MPRLPAYTNAGKPILQKLPIKPWKTVGTNIFSIDHEKLLYIVYYYSKLPVMRRVDGLSADNLIRAAKVMLAEFGLPKK